MRKRAKLQAMAVTPVDDDWLVRQAAFRFVEESSESNGGVIHFSTLQSGFEFMGNRITLAGMRGIWTPRVGTAGPISIRTSARDPYGDEIDERGLLEYHYFIDSKRPREESFGHRDNAGLRRLMEQGRPLIYLQSVGDGFYAPIWPMVIVDDDPMNHRFKMACEDINALAPGLAPSQLDEARRAYVTRVAMVRLHQAGFRNKVLAAYRNRCTICRLKHPELLDAAHIVPDKHELGDPVVPNGLSMCKIHHAAFDANIIGIRPDLVLEVKTEVLQEVDGPMLRFGIQETHGTILVAPNRVVDRPDPIRLEIRYEQFRSAG
ncbi:MAG: hypothetical protein FGM58_06215 [Acidimicrobiia bacterium]|nr:hypothetical protein [Acidimicrobiia bacterium]